MKSSIFSTLRAPRFIWELLLLESSALGRRFPSKRPERLGEGQPQNRFLLIPCIWFCYAENIYSRLVREKAFSSIITNLTDSVDTGIENDVGHTLTLTLTLVPFISICLANLGSPHVSAWKISVHIFVHTA